MNFKDKVVYQIYPKSFYDTNQDGIGDIKGIIEKLDYLELLGVDYIWMNPIFKSPQFDNGYDIEDFYEIDPLYGTMEDVENLINEAKKRNIYIMMDMVLNHTSIQHKWFQKALNGEQEYKDCYFFVKGKEGVLPTNWESKFKGDTWKYLPETSEYYLHLFHETQADLNWKNEKVRNEAANVVNFWIDKGIKGFRFDVINLIDKESFEDDYEGIGKRFYTDRPLVHDYLKELNNNSFGPHDDIITVGEFSSTTVDNCVKYTGEKSEELTMAFSFHHLKVDYDETDRWNIKPFDFKELKRILIEWQVELQKGKGWNALFWCCHDQPRILSRYGNDKKYPKESAKMLATALHFMRGTPYIYQGEEIGMTNAYFDSIDKYRDIAAINCHNEMKKIGRTSKDIFHFLQSNSRDNARTPMHWNKQLNAGFSTTKPWIDLIDNYKCVNVEENLKDKNSVFYHYKKIIQLRKQLPVIQDGEYIPLLEDHEQIYAYKRVLADEEIVVYCNFYDQSPIINIDDVKKYDILNTNVNRRELNSCIELKPYESLVIKIKK